MNDYGVLIDGQFVSARVERIVLAIKEYDQDLHVQWIPPSARKDNQSAFKISYEPVGQEPFTLFYVKTEDEFDERVIQRIIVNDQRKGEHNLSDYEAWDQSNRLVEQQKFLDELEEVQDVVKHIIDSKKNTYKVNDDFIIKEGIPFNVARNRR